MQTKHREFLCLGDTVLFTPTRGLPAIDATVTGIQFSDQPGNQRLTIVKWELADNCTITLGSGRVVSGKMIDQHEHAKPDIYQLQADQCN